MPRLFPRRLFRPFAVTSIALSAGAAGAMSRPEDAGDGPLDTDDAEHPVAHPRERARTLLPLARHSQPEVRARVAEALGTLYPEGGESIPALLRELARDESWNVRAAAAVGLARAIERAPAPARVELVCEWVLSEQPSERVAVARALSWPTAVFVSDLAIEQLASDVSPEVRRAALDAAACHFDRDPTTYQRIAQSLSSDADPSVREAATALLDDSARTRRG